MSNCRVFAPAKCRLLLCSRAKEHKQTTFERKQKASDENIKCRLIVFGLIMGVGAIVCKKVGRVGAMVEQMKIESRHIGFIDVCRLEGEGAIVGWVQLKRKVKATWMDADIVGSEGTID